MYINLSMFSEQFMYISSQVSNIFLHKLPTSTDKSSAARDKVRSQVNGQFELLPRHHTKLLPRHHTKLLPRHHTKLQCAVKTPHVIYTSIDPYRQTVVGFTLWPFYLRCITLSINCIGSKLYSVLSHKLRNKF